MRTDPSFATVDPEAIKSHIEDATHHARQDDKEAFLLSAMRLLALSDNGHTRLIPNDAISVLPVRFVAIGQSVFLTKTAEPLDDIEPQQLIAVNGVPIEEVHRAASRLLPGTPQRKRVIGAILYAWPAALADLGFASSNHETSYHLQNADGRATTLTMAHSDTVPASSLYPRNEHGQVDPVWHHSGFVERFDWEETGI